MRLLLDTHAFLWYYSGSAQLSVYAQQCLNNPHNEFWVSMASIWEIGIKVSIGKLDLDKSFDFFCQDVVSKGFALLPIDLMHIQLCAKMPWHHRDPFDRLLVAQSITENLDFVTADAIMNKYFLQEQVKIIW